MSHQVALEAHLGFSQSHSSCCDSFRSTSLPRLARRRKSEFLSGYTRARTFSNASSSVANSFRADADGHSGRCAQFSYRNSYTCRIADGVSHPYIQDSPNAHGADGIADLESNGRADCDANPSARKPDGHEHCNGRSNSD
jgi:hypothetical protein